MDEFQLTLNKAPFGKRDSICSNEGPCPFPRGNFNGMTKIFKSSSELMGQFQPQLTQCILRVIGIQVLQIRIHSILKK